VVEEAQERRAEAAGGVIGDHPAQRRHARSPRRSTSARGRQRRRCEARARELSAAGERDLGLDRDGIGSVVGGARAGGRGRVVLDRLKMDMYIFAVYMGGKCTRYRLFVAKCTSTNLQQDLTAKISPERPQLCGIAAFSGQLSMHA
jgi:hypothetical protein